MSEVRGCTLATSRTWLQAHSLHWEPAMRYRSLAATFRDLVLVAAAAVPLGASACPGGSCEDITGTVTLVEPLDAELQPLFDACRSGAYTAEACEAMCIELIERDRQYAWDASYETVTACAVDPATARVDWAYPVECIGGRRPHGYAGSGTDLATLGGYFAEQARLEAASVRAFHDLSRALAAHGAPRVLIDACRRAAADEVVHAVLCARLARRFGAAPALEIVDAPAPVPALEDLARANAEEGCVREGWGALLAAWQAHAAADPEVRATMARIAPDEAAHATLSRAIHRWALGRLDADAAARVRAARSAAIAALSATVAEGAPAELACAAGLPDAEVAIRLLAGIHATAWAA